ncbi:hypothetical protein [Actinomadura sp. HBU206391]|uniref:hypothetical protein n=1 Tax=Actinomadura sp. HBU206391 TaxID=2731692 RepID=UPI00164FEC19|nr:hypothetical protein [Actinomadura sp. HBU206391]MBC6462695.1 hypothetical protein [Actinomadura sp. HBU206391]
MSIGVLRPTAIAVMALPTILVAGGCATDEDGSRETAPATTAPSGTVPSTTVPPGSPPAGAAPGPEHSARGSASVSPSPAERTGTAACLHGRCRVAVSPGTRIRLDGRSGPTELSVVGVDHDEVSIKTTSRHGTGTAQTGPGCSLVFQPDGSGSYCGQEPEIEGRGLIVRVLSVRGGTAVLDLSSR